ncbi:C40 family peptidase [Rhodopila sp.]|uniref:C40 family peptidase n=1 Tax=Rhodopila sp. TaxID=2480087 RepID=UPI003D1106B1
MANPLFRLQKRLLDIMDIEQETRAAIVAEARTWVGTKYHVLGQLKRVGVDCMTLVVLVAKACGLLGDFEIKYYSPQFNLHRSTETYLDGVLKYCREVETPQPGDIVLWKFGRCYSHGAIVVDWPTVIHAHVKQGVVMENVEQAGWLTMNGSKPRERKFFSYWKCECPFSVNQRFRRSNSPHIPASTFRHPRPARRSPSSTAASGSRPTLSGTAISLPGPTRRAGRRARVQAATAAAL